MSLSLLIKKLITESENNTMPLYKVYNLNSSNAIYTFCGEFLTPEDAVISAYHYDNLTKINEPLIDYVKNNRHKVTKGNSNIIKGTYYNYNDYCVMVRNEK